MNMMYTRFSIYIKWTTFNCICLLETWYSYYWSRCYYASDMVV